MKPQGCAAGLAVFALVGLGILAPVGLFGSILLAQSAYNGSIREFRTSGDERDAVVLERRVLHDQRGGFRSYRLDLDVPDLGLRFQGVEVDDEIYRRSEVGTALRVWVLGDRARPVQSEARIALVFKLMLGIVPLSLVGLVLLFRAALRDPDGDGVGPRPGLRESAGLGRRAAWSNLRAGAGRAPEQRPAAHDQGKGSVGPG